MLSIWWLILYSNMHHNPGNKFHSFNNSQINVTIPTRIFQFKCLLEFQRNSTYVNDDDHDDHRINIPIDKPFNVFHQHTHNIITTTEFHFDCIEITGICCLLSNRKIESTFTFNVTQWTIEYFILWLAIKFDYNYNVNVQCVLIMTRKSQINAGTKELVREIWNQKSSRITHLISFTWHISFNRKTCSQIMEFFKKKQKKPKSPALNRKSLNYLILVFNFA